MDENENGTKRDLQGRKDEMCKIRDECAEEYTKYIQLLVENENNPELYEYYLKKIAEMEPFARNTKAKMREVNRELAKLNKK
jgi:hypothetical protein